MIEMESGLMGCWIVLVLVSDAELKLGREKVRARVVLPVRHLGTGKSPVITEICFPARMNSF